MIVIDRFDDLGIRDILTGPVEVPPPKPVEAAGPVDGEAETAGDPSGYEPPNRSPRPLAAL